MFTPELACLDFQECSDLPPGTLVAPLTILREIRCAIGASKIKLLVGDSERVLVSTDLFQAFQDWEDAQDEDQSGDDPALLN